MDAFRAQLDEMMGKDRDLVNEEKQRYKKTDFTDPDICKGFLCGYCPSELFINTKSDLGPCNLIHDDNCKEAYQNCKDKSRYPYHREWIRYLERLIMDLDRKIAKGYERLEYQDERPEQNVTMSEENAKRFADLTKQITDDLQQVEEFGEEGKIEEAEALMQRIELLKGEKEALILVSGGAPELPVQMAGLGAQLEKKMKVCEVCGAFLVVGDTEKRTVSHLDGKQHQGYFKIRQTIEEYKAIQDQEQATRASARDDRDYDRRDNRSRGRHFYEEDRRERRHSSSHRHREYDRDRNSRRERR